MFTPGAENVEIIPDVQPRGQEPVLVKHDPKSLRETGPQALLEEQEIAEAVIIGAISAVQRSRAC